MATHQAPLSLGFSRQEYWSGLPFPSPMHACMLSWLQSCLTLCNPMDSSLPGSSAHRIFQARVLEWVAISFSKILVSSSVQLLSRVRLCNPMNRSMPGFPVLHQLLEFTQIHVHRVGDAIQPSHPLSSTSPSIRIQGIDL